MTEYWRSHWVLGEDGEPRRPESKEEALAVWEDPRRIIVQTTVAGILVSTVFLSIDHGFGGERPVLFETMVFKSGDEKDCERWCTRAEAVEGHARIVERVKREAFGAEWCDGYDRALKEAGHGE